MISAIKVILNISLYLGLSSHQYYSSFKESSIHQVNLEFNYILKDKNGFLSEGLLTMIFIIILIQIMNENQRLEDDQELNEHENEENEQNDYQGMIHHKDAAHNRKNIILNITISILIIIIIGLVCYHHYFLVKFTKVQVKPIKGEEGTQQNNQEREQPIGPFITPPEPSNEDKMVQQIKKQIKNNIEKVAQNPPSSTTDRNKYPQLADFQSEPVYKNADPQMKAIFDEMITRPPERLKNRPNTIFMPSQKAYFAFNLFEYPDNENYLKAQYYYYDKKYKIGSFEDELPICIVAPGRNLGKNNKFTRFLDSLERQNYTNYKLIYIDDVSDDNTPSIMGDYINSTLPNLKDKVSIVVNNERVYALANRNKGIRNYCHQDDIVLDVDADDAFIGKQALKWVNALYHNSDLWQSNSVFIYIEEHKKQVTTGPKDGVPENLLKTNAYRGSMVWKTSELRTFRAKLFNKIDENDFKDEKGEFYRWASDVFTQEPLVELAGQNHYKHFYEIVYFYDWKLDRTTLYTRRHYRDISWCGTPYKPLLSLDDKAEKVANYTVPIKAKKQYDKNLIQGRKEAQKYKRQVLF